jgi:1-pyrroline dehydrogenase
MEAAARSAAQPQGNFIGRQSRAAANGGVAEVINPATGAVLASVADSDAEDVDQAVRAAGAAAQAWARETPAGRATALLALADLIDANAVELARIESLNVGKPLAMATEEMAVGSDNLRFLAGAARCLSAPAPGEYVSGHTSIITREPLGVVGGIAPWNYPLMMAVWKFGPAIAAGNTCVIKPSKLTPLSLLRFAELARDVLPPGVLNVVAGGGEAAGAPLARHPGVAAISLTGSVASGRSVARNAADNLTRASLELGGKAPMVVFEDADLDAVADAVKLFGYWNSGQECGAITRVIAPTAIYDDLLVRLQSAVDSIVVGNPERGEHVEMGPVISADQKARVLGFIQRAEAAGGEIVTGGGSPEGPGFFVSPTLIANVEQSAEIVQEEVFGPVVTVQRATDPAQCIEWANDVRYGLSASVWTNDLGVAHRSARDIDAGTVWVNSHLVIGSELPWGGFKESGYGSDMSVLAIEEYTRIKHVMLQTAEQAEE